AQQRLGPIVREGLRTAINSRTLQEVVSSARSELTDALVTAANRAAQNLGIQIVDVRIKRIDLPEESSVLRSVYERMRSERKQVADSLRAQGNEAAARIRAEADRQVQVLKAEAYRDAQKLRGEGDAQAADISAAAYGADPEFYSFYRSLEAYRNSLGKSGNGVLVLDPTSEFLHYLKDSKCPMPKDLAAALCLVLVIEGLFLFASPGLWKRMAEQLQRVDERSLRFVGAAMI